MQDEKNNNQPVILNLNPVNDSISQFIQLQSGILSEQEMFVPSDSILPQGARVKIEYRLKSFGQKENVKIIDAIAEVIGPEVDSEKGRRGVRVKFLKLSPTSQMLIQKLLEKMRAARPQSGEKKVEEPPQEPKAQSAEETKKVEISEPTPATPEPKVQISEPQEEPKVEIKEPKTESLQSIPSISDVMARLEQQQKAENPPQATETPAPQLSEIMSKEIPASPKETTADDKPAQYILEYLPPGQPIEENTGIVKIREIIRSTDVSSVKRSSKIWIYLLVLILIIGGTIAFFFFFPQYAPKIFIRSHEVSSVIREQAPLQPTVLSKPAETAQVPSAPAEKVEEKKAAQPEEKKEEKVEQKEEQAEKKEEKKEQEKVAEPEIQPLTEKKTPEKKEEAVKIVSSEKIKRQREKEKKVIEEKEKREEVAKAEKAKEKVREEDAKAKTQREARSAEPGRLVIRITPTDADITVFIDGAQAGTMPTITKLLPAGTHTIKVVADGYNDEVRQVDLGEGENKTIDIKLKSK